MKKQKYKNISALFQLEQTIWWRINKVIVKTVEAALFQCVSYLQYVPRKHTEFIYSTVSLLQWLLRLRTRADTKYKIWHLLWSPVGLWSSCTESFFSLPHPLFPSSFSAPSLGFFFLLLYIYSAGHLARISFKQFWSLHIHVVFKLIHHLTTYRDWKKCSIGQWLSLLYSSKIINIQRVTTGNCCCWLLNLSSIKN